MSVEEYIEKCPQDRQEAMQTLRTMILRAFPLMNENTQYKMPTYSHEGEIVFAFASQKQYMAFYVCHHDLLDRFADTLEGYNCGKSCIRFKLLDKQVLKDLKKISTYVYKNIDSSQYYGKYNEK